MSPEDQLQILSFGAEEILPEGALLERLRACEREKRPLRVKQGFDPTAPDIHLGHTVGLRKLRQFQDLGHQVVLIVGDYTGMVGDPSGRSKTRPQLTQPEIEANATTYLDQFFRVLERDPVPPRLPAEVHRNGDWFERMGFMDVLRMASQYTVSQLLERDDFSKRMQARHPIGVHELMYPLMQGYDSVAIRADVELGATEQKFNLLVGRELQRIHGQPQQIVLMLPVLPGLDGVQRMSKSLGNYIGVADSPAEMFGKVMSLPDSAMRIYWRLVCDIDEAERLAVERDLSDASVNPMTVKKRLGERLVAMYHGAEAATQAVLNFEAQFSRREVPDNLEIVTRDDLVRVLGGLGVTVGIKDFLFGSGLAASRSAAWRAVDQGAVSLDGLKVSEREYAVDPARAHVVRLGRRMKRYEPQAGT